MSISEIIALSSHIEKLGIIGVLVVLNILTGYALFKLYGKWEETKKELNRVYAQRDKARLALVKCKAALDAKGITVDLSDVADLVGGDA